MMDNQQFTRYAPPRTNGEPDSTRHGNYLAEPQALPAGNAKEWIGAAWRLFKLRPGKLIGAALLFGAINIGLGMIPYIGGLLQAQGIQADSEERTAFDPEFLMQQMEWREELAAARAANSAERLAALDNQVAAEEARLLAKLSTAFQQTSYAQAAELVPQGRFLDKIRQEIRAAL